MTKINQLVLQALLGLAHGVTQVIFAVLGFYPVIVDKVSRKHLYGPESKRLKRWITVGLLRILGIIILPLTALLAAVLKSLHRLILGVITTLFTGD